MRTLSFLRFSVLPATLAACLALSGPVFAQQTNNPPAAEKTNPPTPEKTTPAAADKPAPGVASAVGAVTLPVTAVDEKGNPVKNLTAAELKLTDNGSEQKIESFAPATPTPMNFAIIAQTTPGLKTELGDMRLASEHFIDHTLPAGQDNFLLIQYGTEVDLLVDPTRAQDKLHDATDHLGGPQFGGNDDTDATHWGGTLYDAIYLAATEELKKQPGQHVLILISDGVDRDSKESMSDAIQAAQTAHTAIFAIYYPSETPRQTPQREDRGNRRGPGFPGGGPEYPGTGGGGGGRRGGEQPREAAHPDGKANLEHLCGATGGYMVEGKHDKADEAFNRIANLLKNQYTLSFVPTQEAAASAFERITLTTERKNVWPLVQQGYSAEQQ
ncbi:MAG TPA: VWA domain-containing protein [Acidobacteriaceae bacterium]|nr:VWA domain-containing protein [Acidobacteriaceae bacterium]